MQNSAEHTLFSRNNNITLWSFSCCPSKVPRAGVDPEVSMASALQAWPKNTVSMFSTQRPRNWCIFFVFYHLVMVIKKIQTKCPPIGYKYGCRYELHYQMITFGKVILLGNFGSNISQPIYDLDRNVWYRSFVQKANRIVMLVRWEENVGTLQAHLQGLVIFLSPCSLSFPLSFLIAYLFWR